MLETPETPRPKINHDPRWHRYIATLEPEVFKIANKFTMDSALREDCEQEARMALLTVFPERVRGWENYLSGETSEEDWLKHLKKYCCNVIRNAVFSYLKPWNTGNWYIGRNETEIDEQGNKVRIHKDARYSSLEELSEEFGFDVDEDGNPTWPKITHDGLQENGGFVE